ncbi:hypothetical protein BDZ88DRAFT_424118 [Geranomyces variabilis]|nr:hypothetical protein BDZ88DRAFT_424118 [Geranomyces variabilis]
MSGSDPRSLRAVLCCSLPWVIWTRYALSPLSANQRGVGELSNGVDAVEPAFSERDSRYLRGVRLASQRQKQHGSCKALFSWLIGLWSDGLCKSGWKER